MLIRNACIDGYNGLVDLRVMHGAVREIGVGLVKGLYESELDIGGDALRPWCGETLARPLRRSLPPAPAGEGPIVPGTPLPLMRWDAAGRLVGAVHQHSAD